MSFGKMRSFIYIVSNEPTKDEAGFAIPGGEILASVRAYKEMRHGNESWRNRASFSSSNALFRFRKIPGLEITPAMAILSDGERYNINSVEDVRGRGMYIEVLAEKIEPSKN
jgi:head-tail adaptor